MKPNAAEFGHTMVKMGKWCFQGLSINELIYQAKLLEPCQRGSKKNYCFRLDFYSTIKKLTKLSVYRAELAAILLSWNKRQCDNIQNGVLTYIL